VCVENCAKTGHSFCAKFYLVAVSVVAATVVAAAAVAVVAAAAAAGVAFLIESDMLINLDLVEGTVLPYPLTYRYIPLEATVICPFGVHQRV
jgi:hypothetical protein